MLYSFTRTSKLQIYKKPTRCKLIKYRPKTLALYQAGGPFWLAAYFDSKLLFSMKPKKAETFSTFLTFI